MPPAYESVPIDLGKDDLVASLEGDEVDCVTFTASSTVENFVRAFGAEESERLLERARVACIGPITAETARGYGLRVDAEAEEYTMPGLVEAVMDLFAAEPVEKDGR